MRAGRDQPVGGDAPGGVHVLLVDGHVARGEGLAGAPLLRAAHHGAAHDQDQHGPHQGARDYQVQGDLEGHEIMIYLKILFRDVCKLQR